MIRSFEKRLADRGGWPEELFPVPEIEASFLHPFSYAPLGEGGRISGEVFWLFFGGSVRRQPPPANPFSMGDMDLGQIKFVPLRSCGCSWTSPPQGRTR